MKELIYKEECYKIIGLCMEVHNKLGTGLSEILYKDALEYEFKKNNILTIGKRVIKLNIKK